MPERQPAREAARCEGRKRRTVQRWPRRARQQAEAARAGRKGQPRSGAPAADQVFALPNHLAVKRSLADFQISNALGYCTEFSGNAKNGQITAADRLSAKAVEYLDAAGRTVVSLDMAYRLYGAISVNANFRSCAPYDAACLRTDRDPDNDGLQPSGSRKMKRSEGELAIQRGSIAPHTCIR
jgi:hypothetical protein